MQTMLDLFEEAGYKNYEEMEIDKPYPPKKGIEVLSYDDQRPGSLPEYKRVKNLFFKGNLPGYKVYSSSGKPFFMCTADHAFLTKKPSQEVSFSLGSLKLQEFEWKSAKDLPTSFEALSDTGHWILVTLEPSSEEFPVLDIEVEDNHCYFTNGILSHNSFGGTAKLFSEGLRKLNPYLSRYGTSMILLNQIRDQIGGFAMPGMKPESTPGGRAVKFYASWRARVSKMEDIADKKEVIGNTIKIRNVKSKVGFPKRLAALELYYGTGFNPDQEYVDFIIKLGLVKQGGAWISNEEWGMKVQGRDKFLDWLKANPEKFNACKEIVNQSFTSNTVLDSLGADEETPDDDIEVDEE